MHPYLTCGFSNHYASYRQRSQRDHTSGCRVPRWRHLAGIVTIESHFHRVDLAGLHAVSAPVPNRWGGHVSEHSEAPTS